MVDSRSRVPVIGLIGGVGSGKSFVARLLSRQHRVAILDADACGHRVLQEPAVQEKLRRRFGDEVFHPDGTVNRRAVGQRVFGTSLAEREARAALEAIVHPRIFELLTLELNQARETPGIEAVLLDAAVLLESGWRDHCDAILFIDAPLEQRLERVARTRGWSREQLLAREASQISLDRKRTEADYVIDNSRSPEHVAADLEQILQRIQAASLSTS